MYTIILECLNADCDFAGEVNRITDIDEESIDSVLEAFGHGYEEDSDYCPHCFALASPVKVIKDNNCIEEVVN
jgi:hypothetical protein